jgi:hypothetical protein
MTEEKISISEALAEIKRINKLLPSKYATIERYASKKQNSRDEIVGQKAYVAEQRQSVEDLLKRMKNIKLAIAKANLETFFDFKGKRYSIAEALLYKSKGFSLRGEYEKMWMSFNNTNGVRQLMEFRGSRALEQQFSAEELAKIDMIPELYYSPPEIQKQKDDLLEFMSMIDAIIDRCNHQTIIVLK